MFHIQALLCWILPVSASQVLIVETSFGYLKPLTLSSIVQINSDLGKGACTSEQWTHEVT
jgi:hypothetical protein